MNLTADSVDLILRDSLYLDEEMVDLGENGAPRDAVLVEGVVNTYAFHPHRLGNHRKDLAEMIGDLPREFVLGEGGGWTFLNLCMTKGGVQWTGLHQTQEQFYALCAGLGMARVQLPREMWSALPGGVPYISFDPEGSLKS